MVSSPTALLQAQNRAAQKSQTLELVFPEVARLLKPSAPAMSCNAVFAILPLELASRLGLGIVLVRDRGWHGQGSRSGLVIHIAALLRFLT